MHTQMKGIWWAIAATGVAWLGTTTLACNAISGADAIVLDDVDDDGGNGNQEVASGAGPGSGAGGNPAGPGATSGAGGHPTTGGGPDGSGPSTGAGAGTTSGGGDDPGPTQCEYPAGPYGVAQGQTVPPGLSWQGFAPGNASATTVTIEEFFDCDGSKGIHAVLIDTSQFG
jgi:hypothetical protein